MGGRGGGGGGGGTGGGGKKAFLRKITSLYNKGKSLSQIAAATGKSASTIHDKLTKAGVQLRPRGGQSKRK